MMSVIKATELLRECLSIRENSLSSTHPHLIIGMVHSIQHSVLCCLLGDFCIVLVIQYVRH